MLTESKLAQSALHPVTEECVSRSCFRRLPMLWTMVTRMSAAQDPSSQRCYVTVCGCYFMLGPGSLAASPKTTRKSAIYISCQQLQRLQGCEGRCRGKTHKHALARWLFLQINGSAALLGDKRNRLVPQRFMSSPEAYGPLESEQNFTRQSPVLCVCLGGRRRARSFMVATWAATNATLANSTIGVSPRKRGGQRST